MIHTANRLYYEAFGLKISSEILLCELPQKSSNETSFDVLVTISDLSNQWSELAIGENTSFIYKENSVMFKISDTAIFCIQAGNQIIVSPINEADEDKIRLYILGTCMGALLIQRDILPLHGSAVEIYGKAYAFVGDSGAGKSTLAKAFLNKGFPLLSDDVVAVSLADSNIPVVMPSYPQQKLWQESLIGFGMKPNEYRPLFKRETKYSVPVTSFSDQLLPLAGVFELVKIENETLEIEQIRGLDRLHLLYRQTFRNFFISHLGKMEWHFNTTTQFLDKISVFKLTRPTKCFAAPNLANLVLDIIDREGYNS